ncbi:MAG: hypothetical protein RKO66_12265 [Candidatus Contendobacter sp.]|nr:hypothetical protein [Candidatus Contendobacter sp.]
MREDGVGWLGTLWAIEDALTEWLRQGARGLIERAVKANLQMLLDWYERVLDLGGCQAVVYNGYRAERDILTGLAP